jgi:cytochrome bd-type quinol oxidase subunit 1
MKPLDIYVWIVGIVYWSTFAVAIFLLRRYIKKNPPKEKQAGEDRPAD